MMKLMVAMFATVASATVDSQHAQDCNGTPGMEAVADGSCECSVGWYSNGFATGCKACEELGMTASLNVQPGWGPSHERCACNSTFVQCGNQCVCPIGMSVENDECQCTNNGQIPDEEGGCSCKIGMEMKNGVCQCSPGYYGTGECTACTDIARSGVGAGWGTMTERCDCPSDQELDGSQCVCSDKTKVKQDGNGECVCKEGYFLKNDKCVPCSDLGDKAVPKITATEGSNSAWNKCTCSHGYKLSGHECKCEDPLVEINGSCTELNNEFTGCNLCDDMMDISYYTFRYTAGENIQNTDMSDKHSCKQQTSYSPQNYVRVKHSATNGVFVEDNVDFNVTKPEKSGKKRNNLKLTYTSVDGYDVKCNIHVSCSVDLIIGEQFGPFKLVGFENFATRCGQKY